MKCFVLKTIILGDCGVGKTTMLYKYYNGNFNSDNQSTVGVNFVSKYVKNLNCEFSDSIKIQIWDTAGQERFRSIIRSYYRNICGCIIAYDITNKNTFNNSLYWMDEVRKNNKDVVLILVGTKNDLEDKREIDYEDGVKLSNHYNIPFFEISSKECVDSVFDKMVEMVINKIEKNTENQEISQFRGVLLIDDNNNGTDYGPTFLRRATLFTSNTLCCNN